MPRLIDAEALSARMYHDAFETDSDMQKWDSGCWIRYKMFENAIADAPTVDAVEVVRCKDCILWNKERQICDRFSSTWTAEHTKPNDYCCWGERKEDAKTD